MSDSLLLDTIVPAIGVCTTMLLNSSCIPVSLRARKNGYLEQDPTPSVMAFFNSTMWVIYGSMINDLFVFTGNFYAVVVNAFTTLVALRYCNHNIRTRLDVLFVGGFFSTMLIILVLSGTTIIDDQETRESIMSVICISVCLVMFASPLIQGAEALRTQNVAEINVLLCFAQIANGVLWASYGFSQEDPTIWIPNGLSIGLAFTNLGIKAFVNAITRNKKVATQAKDHKTIMADAVANGTPIVVRSMWFNDKCLHAGVGALSEPLVKDGAAVADLELQQNITYIQGESMGASALQLVPIGTEGEVGLRLMDGRFVVMRSAVSNGCSEVQPSAMCVVAVAAANGTPEAEGRFTVVHEPAREMDSAMGMVIERNLGQESITFYNRAAGAFLRCNEKGFFDSSPRWTSERAPIGWIWERFAVEVATSESKTAPAASPEAGKGATN